MKKKVSSIFAQIAVAAVAVLSLYSCSNSISDNNNSTSGMASSATLHSYGLNPMQPSDWAYVPRYGSNLTGRVGSASEVLPGSCLLLNPGIRDQGQIGSCTGFCGTEANEILNYYKVNQVDPMTGFTTSAGISKAASSQFSPTSLSPLFLYYVERCVIGKQKITSDPGAYMVNICQAFQGLSNNAGNGLALTLNGATFKGECTETLYPYPSPASTSSTQFRTAPGSSAISNAPNYSIGAQLGLTSSSSTSNSTTGGYFVIKSTGGTLISDVKDAIFNKKPVMMGFNVYDNYNYAYFEGLNTSKYIYNPITSSGKLVSGVRLLGGHAVPIIGYIDDASQPGGGVVILQNSWGTSWGYNGYFYMPYSVLSNTTVVPAGGLFVMI